MNLYFHPAWAKGAVKKNFKSEAAWALLDDYCRRIERFGPCAAKNYDGRGATGKWWLCDRSPAARVLSSEAVAAELVRARDGGARELHVVIGGPDGFSEKEIAELRPDLRWSFGPLTLPHELAAVVAAEQIYRAWTITAGLPYHKGH